MNAFRQTELSQAGVAVLDCEHKTPPDADDGHPYVAIPNLVDGRLDLTNVRRITDEHLREWTRRTQPRAGDIIVTRRGRVGDTAVIPDGLTCAIGQNLVLLRSDGAQVDQNFLRWATRGPDWQREVNRLRNVGAVFDSLNVRDIARLRIPVPPLEQQRRIAGVLGVLDEKIEFNARLCERLAETALTSVRRLLATKKTSRTTLGHIVSLHRHAAPAGSELPYIGLDQMPRGSTILSKWQTEGGPTGQALLFEAGDILFGKLRPYFRKGGVALIDGRCSSEILVLHPTRPELFALAVSTIASDAFIKHCVAVSSGTRMPRSEWSAASAFACEEPCLPDGVAHMTKVSGLARAAYASIRQFVNESKRLEAIRDALLPNLMSRRALVAEKYEPAAEVVRRSYPSTEQLGNQTGAEAL
jgi:type I restriction enzyme S subunit